MKRMIFPFILLALAPFFCFAQPIENIDFISPFNEDVAAIKKGNLWAFVDTKGNMIIDFRDDLVSTRIEKDDYPIFKNNRCLISQKKDGISYFGYIDKTGKTVIEPQFLNATHFENNKAVVLNLKEEFIGDNTILDKKVISYKYFEVVIDDQGNTKNYLDFNGIAVALDKKYLYKPPQILRQLISDSLFIYLNRNKKWVIEKIK
jgi:hypothetical protein